ncbi:protein of unknown function [Blastococcus saxobsidens DD2]|uniref:Uncharacterized protein n=1 Tax=Blastococcus saxobsidens (strain DD2) TaxID=1146883 RepID=H6RIQ8_BLASD|nr:protein of unknown function [Blastococcus saxobsidens DD2]
MDFRHTTEMLLSRVRDSMTAAAVRTVAARMCPTGTPSVRDTIGDVPLGPSVARPGRPVNPGRWS